MLFYFRIAIIIMPEKVSTYLLAKSAVAIPMDRDEFYQEQINEFKKTKKATRAVEIVDLLLFGEDGELYVQKRNDKKFHNPGLLDKSIGGHIQFGDSVDYTVMVETVQEMRVPSIVLRNDDDYVKTFKLLKNYLNSVAIVKHIDSKTHVLRKLFHEDEVMIANKIHLFFGVYGGPVKTVDKEAKGVLMYSIKDLRKEIDEHPERFTHDLIFFIEYYKSQIQNFQKLINKIIKKS